MAFVDDEDDGSLRSGFSGKILGVLAFAAAAVAAKFLIPAFLQSPSAATPDRVRAEIERDPASREIFGAIRASYPDEYETFLQRFSDTANATKDTWTLRQQAFNFTRGLMRIHFEGLARAPSAALRDIALQYAALYRALHRADVRLCAEAANAGFQAGQELPFDAKGIIAHLGAMQITAARQGEAHPSPPRSPMNEADQEQLLRAIEARSESGARLLRDERAMTTATQEQQCQTAIALYETVGALPPDKAAKATIHLLRASQVPTTPAS